jgi:hypothetical protein
MGADRPDDSDVPSFAVGEPDRPGRSSGGASDTLAGRGLVQAEVRDLCEYYESLRIAAEDAPPDARGVSATPLACGDDPAGFRVSAETSSPESWDEAAERFRMAWAEHRARWPDSGRAPVDRSGDPPGSWRGESGRYLDSAANAEVEKRCDQIAEAERNVISPAMREIEACDPSRQLVGFEHRLKGQDRIKDKVAETLNEQPDVTARDAMSDVPDSIRYTFQYGDDHYAESVRGDIVRLKECGFDLVEVKNSWTDSQYKGINSRWRVADSQERFEVQFHTQTSFEAKQLTHAAYERVRNPLTSPAELRELRGFQREVTSQISIPPEATDIFGYFRRL